MSTSSSLTRSEFRLQFASRFGTGRGAAGPGDRPARAAVGRASAAPVVSSSAS